VAHREGRSRRKRDCSRVPGADSQSLRAGAPPVIVQLGSARRLPPGRPAERAGREPLEPAPSGRSSILFSE